MSKRFQYSKTSEINNIYLNPKIKQIMINFVFDNLKPYSLYVSKELKTREDLIKIQDKNYYIQYKHIGEPSLLLFLRNKDRYYSCIINKKHLRNDPKDIILDDVFIIPFDVSLEIKIYDGTIIDGIYYSNKENQELNFFVHDVLLFRGENKIKDNIRNKFYELNSYLNHFKQNKIIINDIKELKDIEEFYHSLENKKIIGLMFYYYISGFSLFYNFKSQNNIKQTIEKPKEIKKDFKISIFNENREIKLKNDTIKDMKNIMFSFNVKPQTQNKDLYDIYIKNIFIANLFLNLDTHNKLIKQLQSGNNIIKAKFNKSKKHWEYYGEDFEETGLEKIKYYFQF